VHIPVIGCRFVTHGLCDCIYSEQMIPRMMNRQREKLINVEQRHRDAMAEQEEQPEEVEQDPSADASAERADDPTDDEPAKLDPSADEPAEAPADAPAADEPAAVEQKEEAPKEEVKEEPAKEAPPKKKKKKRKRKQTLGTPAEMAWRRISAKNQSEINWYLMKLDGKVGATSDLAFVQEGSGGAAEMVEFLKDKAKNIMFGLLMCVTTDDSKSVRGKFIYLRVVGSKVKMMSKAKLTPTLGKIDDQFPCKHLTLDINEDAANELKPEKLATELLRVGGAHKPDVMSFGPDQEVEVKSLK